MTLQQARRVLDRVVDGDTTIPGYIINLALTITGDIELQEVV